MADGLVHRVVPADVLAKHDEPARDLEQRRGVQTARAVERRLLGAHLAWQTRKYLRANPQVRLQGRKLCPYRFDRRLATQSAARAGEHVARQPFKIDRHLRREQDLQNILIIIEITVLDAQHILSATNDSLGQQESQRKLL